MRLRNRLACAGFVAAIALVAGCTTVSGAPSPSATPTPSQTVAAVMTREDAAAHYLEIVEPVNEIGDDTAEAFDAAVQAGDWEALRALYARYAETDRAFADALAAASWPEEIQDSVDALIERVSADIAYELTIAEAETQADFDQAWNTPYEWSNAAAEEVRLQLGLPKASES